MRGHMWLNMATVASVLGPLPPNLSLTPMPDTRKGNSSHVGIIFCYKVKRSVVI